MIEFLLNGETYQLENANPNRTLLDFIRDSLHQKGTKEGCASGDCGACTVAIGELNNGSIQYKSINACITLLANIHGKHLVTVEGLRHGNQLHPAQQAMIDTHGSQCGFCTPGFVMSLFTMGMEYPQAPDLHKINESLGGNLCRCTGYRPIVDAAARMYDPQLKTPAQDKFQQQQASWAEQLRKMTHARACLKTQNQKYFAPATSSELADLLLQYPKAKMIAGGTDLALEITQSLRSFDTLIYTAGVKELKQIESRSDALVIGAAATYSELGPSLTALYPELAELLERLGSRQIRNSGTLAGNIANASPIGDMPPVLIALNARLQLRSGNSCREIPVEDYFISYKKTRLQESEFIENIIIPRPKNNESFKAYKISKRLEDDISATLGAFLVSWDGEIAIQVRIAFGGMAEIPKRALKCEQRLRGTRLNNSDIEAAMEALAEDFQPISDCRSSDSYRMRVSQNLLKRLQLELTDIQHLDTEMRITHHA